MNVQAVMIRDVKYANKDASAADVAKIMQKNDCGAVPIVDDQKKLVGMITDRDICLGLGRDTRASCEVPVGDLMSRQVYACGPGDDIAAALRIMQNKKVRRLPVVDEHGMLVGILSTDDVVLHSEAKKRGNTREIGYRQTIDTLKAIYRRPGGGRPLITQP
jgi:CBS domain-containing protein